MEHVSGVTGAAPLLHELVEHLHQHYGTTWYSAPTNVVECWIHAVTGKRLDQAGKWSRSAQAHFVSATVGGSRHTGAPTAARCVQADAVREKFLASNLPPFESPADYGLRPSPLDPQTSDFGLRTSDFGLRRAVQLGSEYRDWLASAANWLGDRAVLAPLPGSLRILFPPPGTILYLDPDLPQQGRRVGLRAEGSEGLQWQSDSLSVAREGSRHVALLTEGRHLLAVREPLTGAQAQTWLEVLAR